MERLFGTIKAEFPPLNQLKNLAELHEAIALTIHYYNTKRIHSAFNMPPAQYIETLKNLKKSHTKCLVFEEINNVNSTYQQLLIDVS